MGTCIRRPRREWWVCRTRARSASTWGHTAIATNTELIRRIEKEEAEEAEHPDHAGECPLSGKADATADIAFR